MENKNRKLEVGKRIDLVSPLDCKFNNLSKSDKPSAASFFGKSQR